MQVGVRGLICGKRYGDPYLAYGLYISATGNRLGFWMWDGDVPLDFWSPPFTLNAGEWYHVAVTFDDNSDALIF